MDFARKWKKIRGDKIGKKFRGVTLNKTFFCLNKIFLAFWEDAFLGGIGIEGGGRRIFDDFQKFD